jgi:hypothetical protein
MSPYISPSPILHAVLFLSHITLTYREDLPAGFLSSLQCDPPSSGMSLLTLLVMPPDMPAPLRVQGPPVV